jgi:hypothetical protein
MLVRAPTVDYRPFLNPLQPLMLRHLVHRPKQPFRLRKEVSSPELALSVYTEHVSATPSHHARVSKIPVSHTPVKHAKTRMWPPHFMPPSVQLSLPVSAPRHADQDLEPFTTVNGGEDSDMFSPQRQRTRTSTFSNALGFKTRYSLPSTPAL